VSLFVLSGEGDVWALGRVDFKVKSLAVITRDDRGVPLNYPRSLFYDQTAREAYVIGSGINEVIVFTPDFYPAVSVGHGRGLSGVTSVFVGHDNLIFCLGGGKSDTLGNLFVYDQALLPVGRIELSGFPEADSFRPEQVIAQDGFFYVVGMGSMGLLKFDHEGIFQERIIPRDEILGVEEDAPVKSFEIDSRGRFFLLSEVMGRIFVYSPQGEQLFKFGTKGGSSGKLSRPRALAIDEKAGLIFVVDYMRHAVNVYSMTGDYIFEFGGKGVGRGWLSFPSDITIDDRGRLWVADTFNGRVQVFKITRRLTAADAVDVPSSEGGLRSEIPVVAESPKISAPDSPVDSAPEEAAAPEPGLQDPQLPLRLDEVQESDL
jgi:DNA-binding beta-propeller fold protein YncE